MNKYKNMLIVVIATIVILLGGLFIYIEVNKSNSEPIEKDEHLIFTEDTEINTDIVVEEQSSQQESSSYYESQSYTEEQSVDNADRYFKSINIYQIAAIQNSIDIVRQKLDEYRIVSIDLDEPVNFTGVDIYYEAINEDNEQCLVQFKIIDNVITESYCYLMSEIEEGDEYETDWFSWLWIQAKSY